MNQDNSFSIRAITGEEIFCPFCGTENLFKESSTGFSLNYFCSRCGKKLNDLWEKTRNDEIGLISCDNCHLDTFINEKYCINCGTKVVLIEKATSPFIDANTQAVDFVQITDTEKKKQEIFSILSFIIGICSLIIYPITIYFVYFNSYYYIWYLSIPFVLSSSLGVFFGASSFKNKFGKIGLILNIVVIGLVVIAAIVLVIVVIVILAFVVP
ncbi:MAG: zinc ribbon domain-containing protein [Asgard group archaeon]|nr:zinc ribbon domain-containing protein [Asgard group archaeon]